MTFRIATCSLSIYILAEEWEGNKPLLYILNEISHESWFTLKLLIYFTRNNAKINEPL